MTSIFHSILNARKKGITGCKTLPINLWYSLISVELLSQQLKMILCNAKFLTNHNLEGTYTKNFKANIYEFYPY